jgi:hypothetical protein
MLFTWNVGRFDCDGCIYLDYIGKLTNTHTHTRQVSIIDPRQQQQQQQQQCIMEMISNIKTTIKNRKDVVVDVISMMMMMIPLCSFLYI